MKKSLSVVLFLVCIMSASVFISATAYATNGMNMEGYGPIATGMGGASMAYDNGTAALMNNPATLGLMPQGNRFDLALGYLGPHVITRMPGMPDAWSSGNAYFMPALGWVQKSGAFSYGLGLFAQGGMGTEYGKESFLAAGSGERVRSELSVGRILIPLVYEVTKNFIIGASVDFVWDSLDLKMALTGAQFGDFVAGLGGKQTYGSASGSLVNALGGAILGGQISPPAWARFDFSDDSLFKGKANGYGAAGKIGAVLKATDRLVFGATYHSKTALTDMETDRGNTISLNTNVLVPGPAFNATIPITGKYTVKDFQWPQMVAAGVSWRPVDWLMLVFDYKWINWSDVMKDFKLTFNADQTQSGLAGAFGMGGLSMDATLKQNWKDQHVFMLGAGFMPTDNLTLRVGMNYANNPIPDTYMNPLFPAIITEHYMVGAGYMFTKASSLDASFTYAPEVSVTNGQGVTTNHNQTNVQLMYSYRF